MELIDMGRQHHLGTRHFTNHEISGHLRGMNYTCPGESSHILGA